MRALLLALLVLAPAAAAQIAYTSDVPASQEGLWTSASSWMPRGVPTPADTVIIQHRMELPSNAIVSRLELQGGALFGDGSLTVAHSGEWTGGDLESEPVMDAALTIPTGVTFRIRDGGDKAFRGRDLLVDGRLDWSGSDVIRLRQTSDLHIRPGGEWLIENSGGAIERISASLFVTIDGTLHLTGTGQTTFDYELGSLVVNGTLRLEEGFLTLRASTSAFTSGGTGTLDIRDGGSLFVDGGAYDFSGTHLTGPDRSTTVEATGGRLILGTADFAGSVGAVGGEMHFAQDPADTRVAIGFIIDGDFGGLTQGGGVTVTEAFDWLGGRFSRVGTLVIEDEAVFTARDATVMGPRSDHVFAGGTIVNRGRLLFQNDRDIGVTFTQEIRNEEGGVVELLGDFSLNRTSGFVRFINDGLVVKRQSAGTTRWESTFGSFLNRGEVRVESGRLEIEGSPAIANPEDTGRWVTVSGGQIEFLGRRQFGPASSFEGIGAFGTGGLDAFSTFDLTIKPGLDGYGDIALPGGLPPFGDSGGIELEISQATWDWVGSGVPMELSGTLRIVAPPGNPFAVGDRFSIAVAPEITGEFSALELPPGLSGVLEVTPRSFDELLEFVVTAVVNEEAAPEASLALITTPNPSRGTLRLGYTLPEAGEATLTVHDALGREVAVLGGPRAAGEHEEALSGLAPGAYVAVLTTGKDRLTRRFTVVR